MDIFLRFQCFLSMHIEHTMNSFAYLGMQLHIFRLFLFYFTISPTSGRVVLLINPVDRRFCVRFQDAVLSETRVNTGQDHLERTLTESIPPVIPAPYTGYWTQIQTPIIPFTLNICHKFRVSVKIIVLLHCIFRY